MTVFQIGIVVSRIVFVAALLLTLRALKGDLWQDRTRGRVRRWIHRSGSLDLQTPAVLGYVYDESAADQQTRGVLVRSPHRSRLQISSWPQPRFLMQGWDYLLATFGAPGLRASERRTSRVARLRLACGLEGQD